MITIISALISSITIALSSGEEENENKVEIYEGSPLSEEVEALRADILNELKKYGKEEYINLFLALVMQESGGQGEDVFQCSESLGKAPNSIGKKQSIEHGVKVLCGYLNNERIKVSSPDDLDNIKTALQAYNYGGGYIDYINSSNFGRDTTKNDLQNLGKWTQENALAYQKKKSADLNHGTPVSRTGSAATILGPYQYGDAYYVKHVLRYYSNVNKGGTKFAAKAGEAAKVSYGGKQKYIWGNGNPPLSQENMKKYLKNIL